MKIPPMSDRLRPTWCRCPGFSLIEMLVTISILVVLTAIAFPILASVRVRSEQTLCASRLKAIGQAFFAYANDNDGTLPVIDYVTAGGELKKNTFWATSVMPYLGTTDLNDPKLKCPTIAKKRGNAATSSPWSYSMNNSIADLMQPSTGGGTAKVGKRTVAIPKPSQVVLLFCSPRAWTSVSRGNDIASGGPGRGYGNLITPQSSSSFFGEVHAGKANVLFGDGHVDRNAFQEINSVERWGN